MDMVDGTYHVRTDYEDGANITRYPNQVNNYNTMNHTSIPRTNSQETVWSYNMTATAKTADNANETNTPTVKRESSAAKSDYDPYDFGNMEKPTSFWGTVSNLIIVSAGPTILSIPISFFEVGYITGFIGTLLSTFLYAYSMHILIWSEYKVCRNKRIPSLSYPDLIYFAFKDGPPKVRWFAEFGKCVIDIVFIALWTSGSCYNLELAAENIYIVYNQWSEAGTTVNQVLAWLFVPVLLLCYVPRLKYLVPVSIIANVANILCIVVVIYDVFCSKQPFKGAPAFGLVTQMPLFFGTLFFTLNATGLMLPMKKDMKHPRRFNSGFGILTVTYIPTALTCSMFGLLCTLKYGNQLKETVIENVQEGQLLTQYMVLANALALLLQFPLYFFIVYEVLWNSLLKERKKVWNCLLLREYLVRTIITTVIFLIAYLIPSVELFLTFGGAVGTMIDSLLFPACIQMVVMWKVSKNRSQINRCLVKNTVISLLAIILIISGGISCVDEIIRYYGAKQSPS